MDSQGYIAERDAPSESHARPSLQRPDQTVTNPQPSFRNESKLPAPEKGVTQPSTWYGSTVTAIRFVTTDLRRRKRSFSIGVFTVFLLVFILVYMQNAVSKAPYIFLKLSEVQTGEMDLVLLARPPSATEALEGFTSTQEEVEANASRSEPQENPDAESTSIFESEEETTEETEVSDGLSTATARDALDDGSTSVISSNLTTTAEAATAALASLAESTDFTQFFVNFTDIEQKLAGSDDIAGACPRWVFVGDVLNGNDLDLSTAGLLLVIDSEREKQMGLGRAWRHDPLDAGFVYMTGTAMRSIGVEPGDTIIFNVKVLDLFVSLSGDLEESQFEDFISTQMEILLSAQLDVDVTDDTIVPLVDLVQLIADVIEDQEENFEDDVIETIQDFLEESGADPDLITASTIDELIEQLRDIDEDDLPKITAKDVIDGIVETLTSAFAAIPVPFEVAAEATGYEGKWPSFFGNVVVAESSTFIPQIRDALDDILNGGTDNLGLDLPDISFGGITLGEGFLQSLLAVAAGVSTEGVFDFLDEVNLNDFALFAVVQYTHRLDGYLDYDKLDENVIHFTNVVGDLLGKDYPVSFTVPLAVALQGIKFLQIFLDNLFAAVTFVLLILGAFLVYALMIGDVEEKTYEYGMLRALGMQGRNLIQLLSYQSLLFAVPGVSLGLFFAFIFSIPLSNYFETFTNLEVPKNLTGGAIALGVCLGLFMPLLSTVLPIRRALTSTLRDSLDIYHHVTADTQVTVLKLEEMGVSPPVMALGACMVVAGFIVYYLIPLAFTFRDFKMFFAILNGVLLGMILGLAMISSSLQSKVEQIVLRLLLWGEDRKLDTLIKKNMVAHRKRSWKTALMYTVSVSFIVFAAAMFTMQVNNLTEGLMMIAGSDIGVLSPSVEFELDVEGMSSYLDAEKEKEDSVVVDYSFVTFPLNDLPGFERLELASFSTWPDQNVLVYGVEPNYLQSTFSKYFLLEKHDESFSYREVDGKPDIIHSLYEHAGQATLSIERTLEVPPNVTSGTDLTDLIGTDYSWSWNVHDSDVYEERSMEQAYTEYIDIIVSIALEEHNAMGIDVPSLLQWDARLEGKFETASYLVKTRAMVKKMPGMLFSSFVYRNSPVLVTMDWYQTLMDRTYASFRNESLDATDVFAEDRVVFPETPPMQKLMVKLVGGASRFDRERILDGVKSFITSDTVQVFDAVAIRESNQNAENLLLTFQASVSIIAVCLCFFLLYLSFTANVMENSWEYGVLRSLGLTSRKLLRAYIIEAVCLTISALMLGTVIGILVAITLTLQFNVFMEMPFTFSFSSDVYFGVVAMSIALSVIGSYIPIREYSKKQITQVLKGS